MLRHLVLTYKLLLSAHSMDNPHHPYIDIAIAFQISTIQTFTITQGEISDNSKSIEIGQESYIPSS